MSKVHQGQKRARSQSFDSKSKSKAPAQGGKKFAKDVHGKPKPAKPATPQEARKAQQQKREYRKSLRTHHDVVTQAKTYWERIRDTVNVTSQERHKLIDELLNLIQGSLMDLIRKHDGSRIIQTCIKFGSAQQRKLIFTELEGHFLELAQKKYSRFLVNRFIDSASKNQKESIYKEFYGQVMTMIKHKDACEVIEKAYTHATGLQKVHFVEEFYGNEFALFKATQSRKLADILEEQPEKREQILKNIMEVVNTLLTKGLIYLSISHHVLNEFYENGTPELIREMTGLLAPELVHTVRTRYGAQVAAKCAGYASAKERKAIIKSLKGNILPIAQEPHGHMLIVKLLAVTDDTVLLTKAILRELLDGAEELVNDGNGRLPFLLILAPEQNLTRYFAPPSMELLTPQQVLDSSNELVPASKKDFPTRQQELLQALSEDLLAYCAKHVQSTISDKFGFAVLLEALLNAPQGDKSAVVAEILRLMKRPADEEDHVMSNPIASRLIKTLVANDFSYTQDGKEMSFAEQAQSALKGKLSTWATTDYATAVVVALMKNETTASTVRKELSGKRAALKKKQDVRGIKAILSLLDE